MSLPQSLFEFDLPALADNPILSEIIQHGLSFFFCGCQVFELHSHVSVYFLKPFNDVYISCDIMEWLLQKPLRDVELLQGSWVLLTNLLQVSMHFFFGALCFFKFGVTLIEFRSPVWKHCIYQPFQYQSNHFGFLSADDTVVIIP